MRLVSVHKVGEQPSVTDPLSSMKDSTTSGPLTADARRQDVDLKRANDLVSLHHDVKVRYSEDGGLDEEVLAARRRVSRVLASLGQSR